MFACDSVNLSARRMLILTAYSSPRNVNEIDRTLSWQKSRQGDSEKWQYIGGFGQHGYNILSWYFNFFLMKPSMLGRL